MQVRTVILLALLAIVRKLIILDLDKTGASQLFALTAATLALGGVYWLVRDQDARHRAAAAAERQTADGDHADCESIPPPSPLSAPPWAA